jgi:peroxiredoxin (alkyl hydroperoxide reductase subunit C)
MCDEVMMDDVCCGLMVGNMVPDFKLDTYDAAKGDFGEFSLEETKKAGKWTAVVFYPADFTFV